MILVTGAAGRTGRSVIRAIVSSGCGRRVRAFDIAPEVFDLCEDEDGEDREGEVAGGPSGNGHDGPARPAGPATGPRRRLGQRVRRSGPVEPLFGDMCEVSDVRSAMEGVRTVVHIGPPMDPREADMGRIVVSEARRADVEHIVLFSVTHPQLELMNHQSKLNVERHLLMSRLPFTILQPTYYMQNIDVREAVDTGVLRQPFTADTLVAHVDLEDVSSIAVEVATKGAPHYFATYELCGGDRRSCRELAEVIAAESGHPVRAETRTMTTGDKGGPESTEAEDYGALALLRLLDHYERHGITGNANVLTWLLGRRPTTFAEYVRRSLANPEPSDPVRAA